MGLTDAFPAASELDGVQSFFMMLVYGWILLNASKLLSDGCEMLLLLYGPGVVGGLLIPVLGAVPDCAIILLSGLGSGSKDDIQDQLRVGVGTLCGSTVMLLTIPFGLGIILGLRDYDPVTKEAAVTPNNRPKYSGFTLTNSCVTTFDDIPTSVKIMKVTSLSYWIIQIPAFFYKHDSNSNSDERPWALTGFIVTALAFIGYLVFQLRSALREEQERRLQAALQQKQWQKSLDPKYSTELYQEQVFKRHNVNKTGLMDQKELHAALDEMGLKTDRREIAEIIKMIVQPTTDGRREEGKITLQEFKAACDSWVKAGMTRSPSVLVFQKEVYNRTARQISLLPNSASTLAIERKQSDLSSDQVPLVTNEQGSLNSEGSAIDDEEDCEPKEEEFWELTDNELKMKAFGILIVATAIISVFSDPMVDAINQFGNEIGVSPFYVSFVVTPIASNASEVISGLIFAQKKTNAAISLSAAALLGAACMNNTLALCIFMALVYFRDLEWNFSAEVISLVVVTTSVAMITYRRNIFTYHAFILCALYPICLALVAGLETVGLD